MVIDVAIILCILNLIGRFFKRETETKQYGEGDDVSGGNALFI
jgi:hypothetical protein